MITIAPRTRAATKAALVPLDEIDFPANARPTHADKVGELVKSIQLIGLQSMPTVVERKGRYMLVTGRHRVEAMRVIGKDPIRRQPRRSAGAWAHRAGGPPCADHRCLA
jgi:ParB-like nuclease domain